MNRHADGGRERLAKKEAEKEQNKHGAEILVAQRDASGLFRAEFRKTLSKEDASILRKYEAGSIKPHLSDDKIQTVERMIGELSY